ncbi:hypothetical protein M3175_01560 [Robertmurraya korlensis]|uniref:hypothetical protein n=1 Tax=Robertmurraya korlensis TaxID=519977 RepID=UPI00203FEE0A|nr:hypothetical protein [Robertmurraya korlensis]MCM3599402.1 hypothetical protein [Robertmurraya korlensis]
MANETTKLKIPMPIGTDFFTRANFIAALQAIEDNAVPYTGATKNVNLGAYGLFANTVAHNDSDGDGIYFQWNEDSDSGKFALKSRRVSDNSILNGVIYATKDGIVNLSRQPYVSVSRITNASLAAGVDTQVGFTNKYADIQGEFASNTYVPKESGVYLVNVHGHLSASMTGLFDFVLYENGAVMTRLYAEYSARTFSVTRVLQLTAGNSYTFYVQSDSGATMENYHLQISKLS